VVFNFSIGVVKEICFKEIKLKSLATIEFETEQKDSAKLRLWWLAQGSSSPEKKQFSAFIGYSCMHKRIWESWSFSKLIIPDVLGCLCQFAAWPFNSDDFILIIKKEIKESCLMGAFCIRDIYTRRRCREISLKWKGHRFCWKSLAFPSYT